VRTLVCDAISEPVRATLFARGIAVIEFVAGEFDEVLTAFTEHRIVDLQQAFESQG